MELTDSGLLKAQAHVGGTWVDADDGSRFAVRDPASGAELARVARLSATETMRAIDAADGALAKLARLGAAGRAALLTRLASELERHAEDLARIMTAEQGKPLPESRAEVAYGRAFFEWFAGEAPRIYGRVVPPPSDDKRVLVLRQPVGVGAAITPWNFPSAMIARKLAPALAAGCPMVLKPAEATPLSALTLAELASRAGAPDGAFNVVTTDADGADAVGRALCASPVVRKLSFTGSTAVGKLLAGRCASTVKRVSLELGGNAPFLVFDDADLEAAVEGALIAKFRNCGQTCVSANRFLIQAGIYDAFRDRLRGRMETLQLGPGDRDGTDLGPLIDGQGLAKVERLLDDAREHGADVLLGGARVDAQTTFYPPTLVEGVTPQMEIFREEIFGPIVTLTRFDDEAEAIALANDPRAGLCAYYYSRDLGRGFRVSEALEYGMVGVNTGLISNAAAPFGGVKESGLGREGGAEGIEDWVETKYVCFGDCHPTG
ncbi:MAG: NAD-dependent succinate-semialdehyde dehydrogenase [Myxococcales bacterium]|nr:NAD-dependent succinate-semialdehyde dehydrogenase [Myxococcales bacterium]